MALVSSSNANRIKKLIEGGQKCFWSLNRLMLIFANEQFKSCLGFIVKIVKVHRLPSRVYSRQSLLLAHLKIAENILIDFSIDDKIVLRTKVKPNFTLFDSVKTKTNLSYVHIANL